MAADDQGAHGLGAQSRLLDFVNCRYALPQGLERAHMSRLLDFVKGAGFNSLRVPVTPDGR